MVRSAGMCEVLDDLLGLVVMQVDGRYDLNTELTGSLTTGT